ncbi:alpha/beta hydrolase-fold protein [Roseofilum casamattae]|uniref:Alpha/beta hydrolase-fold protein n=1 Tax=Roseofilum casamattae BLCC-M143 TaxID=3022442 RepID=A0ABT7BUI0_9CYAN|nr:alpha/beta hydrolase-fold protein [Roseofilum casamattae]MDJ1182838.1 alpha/beta hydrolase-fold protein [Roseofilum casamattae BLCC-M143]
MAYCRRYFRFDSNILQREMEVLHFGDSGYPMLLFPSSNGRFFDAEDRGLITALQQHLDMGWTQIFCVDSLDWDTLLAPELTIAERRHRWLALEQHWLKEFIPYVCDEAQNDFLVTAGCSLGATHALNMALRHPQIVRRCIAIAGAYNLSNLPGIAEFNREEADRELYFINPITYMANMMRERWLELGGANTDLKLLTTQHDRHLSEHLHLGQIFDRNGITHHLEIWHGSSDWSVWQAQLAAFA